MVKIGRMIYSTTYIPQKYEKYNEKFFSYKKKTL